MPGVLFEAAVLIPSIRQNLRYMSPEYAGSSEDEQLGCAFFGSRTPKTTAVGNKP